MRPAISKKKREREIAKITLKKKNWGGGEVMAAVESVAEAVKKRVHSTSKSKAPAAKRTKTALEGPSSPSQSSQTTGRRTPRSKAPAAASVFGQAPFEGEPPSGRAAVSVFGQAPFEEEPPSGHTASSFTTPVLSQATSALSQVALPALEPTVQSQPSILSDPVVPPAQADWTVEEGEDCASERSFSPSSTSESNSSQTGAG